MVQLTNRGELSQEAVVKVNNQTLVVEVPPQTTKVKRLGAPNQSFHVSVQSLGLDYSRIFEKKEVKEKEVVKQKIVNNCSNQLTANTVKQPQKTSSAPKQLIEYSVTGLVCLAALVIILKKT